MVSDLFGVYTQSKECIENKTKLSEYYTESQIDTIEEADRIITEGITEWLSEILNTEANETRVDTNYGVYHSERQVIDDLLDGGLEKLSAKELLLLCAAPGEELEANRNRIFDLLYEAYPDCQTKIDIAEKIIERYNWMEHQKTIKKNK